MILGKLVRGEEKKVGVGVERRRDASRTRSLGSKPARAPGVVGSGDTP